MRQHQISILGCGWLGLPLAEHLIKNDFKVKGSTTSQSKISEMRDQDIEAFLIVLEETEVQGFPEAFLSESDTLIIAVPPGLRKNPRSDYVSKIKHLIPFIEVSSIENVLFIGSTSVYLDNQFFPITTEAREFYADTLVAKQLLEAEQTLMENKNFNTTILRFSGLFDEKRHPAKYLSGRSGIKNPDAPVNLIHRTDCIRIIAQLIIQEKWNDVFHAATEPHPKKIEYYTNVCHRMNIPPPKYDMEAPSQGKIIVSTKLMNALDFDFKVTLE